MPAHRSIIKTKKGTIYIASGNKIVYFLWVASISQGSFDNIFIWSSLFSSNWALCNTIWRCKKCSEIGKKSCNFGKWHSFAYSIFGLKAVFWNIFERSSEEIFSKSLKYCTVFPLLEYIVECATCECSMIRKTWIWLVLYYYVRNGYS